MAKIIRKLRHEISELPVLNKLKPYILKHYNKYASKKKNEVFLKRGLLVLSEFDRVLTDIGINYSLVFGTLLGAVREKGFIKHDMDIDVSISSESFSNDIEQSLKAAGFKLIKRFETDNGLFGREDTYKRYGVTIDIFYFYPYDDQLSYTTVLVPFPDTTGFEESLNLYGGVMPIQLILPYSKETERIPFYNLRLPVIKNRIEFLEARYGKNWRIPDPTFVYPKMGDAKCNYRKDKTAKIVFWDKFE